MSLINPHATTIAVFQPGTNLNAHTESALVAVSAEDRLLRTTLNAAELEGAMLSLGASAMHQQAIALEHLKNRLDTTLKEQIDTIASFHSQIRAIDTTIIAQQAQFQASKAALTQQQTQNAQRLADDKGRLAILQAQEQQLKQGHEALEIEANRLRLLAEPGPFVNQFIAEMCKYHYEFYQAFQRYHRGET